jgi:hypothetical protein
MFGEDDINEKNNRRKQKKVSAYSLDFQGVRFSFSKYFKFFMMHFLYFNFLGPMIFFILGWDKKGRMQLYNLHLLRCSWECLLNMFPWITNVLLLLNYSSMSDFGYTELICIMYIIATSSYLKAAIEASRLSTYTTEKLKNLRKRKLTKEEIMQDDMLGDWRKQTPLIVLKHLNMSMFKNEYDDSNFVLNFIQNPKEQTMKHFAEAEMVESSLQNKVRSIKRLSSIITELVPEPLGEKLQEKRDKKLENREGNSSDEDSLDEEIEEDL